MPRTKITIGAIDIRRGAKKFDGLPVKLNKNLGYRWGDPAKDKDLNGNPVRSHYVVIVKIADCKTYKKDGKIYCDPLNAPGVPLVYGGTYYGCGETKLRSSERGLWIDGKLCRQYYQWNVYFVQEGAVYTASMRATIDSRREHARYDPLTDTVRTIPEDACLISWNERGDPVFETDSEFNPYADLIIDSYHFWQLNNISDKKVLALIISNKPKKIL